MTKKQTYILIIITLASMYFTLYWMSNYEFDVLGSAIFAFVLLVLFAFSLFYILDSICELKDIKIKDPRKAYNAPILKIKPYAIKAILFCLLTAALLYSITIVELFVKANMIPSDLSTCSTVISLIGTISSMILAMYKKEKNNDKKIEEDPHF